MGWGRGYPSALCFVEVGWLAEQELYLGRLLSGNSHSLSLIRVGGLLPVEFVLLFCCVFLFLFNPFSLGSLSYLH